MLQNVASKMITVEELLFKIKSVILFRGKQEIKNFLDKKKLDSPRFKENSEKKD